MRPVLGLSNPAFKRQWDDIVKEAEQKLLQAQCAFVQEQSIFHESESVRAKQALKDKLGEGSPDYKEAKAAVDTVSTRVRQEVSTAERKKWNFSLEQLENQKLGIPARRAPTRRPAQQPQAANPGPNRTHRPLPRRPTGPPRRQNRNVLRDILNILGAR